MKCFTIIYIFDLPPALLTRWSDTLKTISLPEPLTGTRSPALTACSKSGDALSIARTDPPSCVWQVWWRYHTMSCDDVIIQCLLIIIQCPVMTLSYYALWWGYHTMPCDDVIIQCLVMTLSYDALWWRYHAMPCVWRYHIMPCDDVII